jgi:hypothetical protein
MCGSLREYSQYIGEILTNVDRIRIDVIAVEYLKDCFSSVKTLVLKMMRKDTTQRQ